MNFRLVIITACTVLAGSGCSSTVNSSKSSNYLASPPPLTVCSGYGCILKDRFSFTEAEIQQLAVIMSAGNSSPQAERNAIRQAIATMEKMARRHLRYQPDIGFSYQINAAKRGQMDCVDESLNTTGYLKFLHQQKMLKFHKPIKNYAARGLILDGRYPHKSARMVDNQGVAWAVDSWKGPDGAPPEVMLLSKWYKGRNSAVNY